MPCHPLVSLIEKHLLHLGFNLRQIKRQNETEITYIIRSTAGSTGVLRLYRYQNEKELPKNWLCFEFGIGIIPHSQAPGILIKVCRDLYTCFVPVRVAAMPFSEDFQILVLLVRSEAPTFNEHYVAHMIDMGLSLADEIREARKILLIPSNLGRGLSK
ncbi:MAG: hypothetical protein K2X47_06865 [Bdellovibrionales bacterium]|nr:hypothetical protein [Bdellovibrionales bacterium]